MRWHCNTCGHWHGRENCTAITTREEDTRRCGCTHHREQEQAA
jgi:hypothetical protein